MILKLLTPRGRDLRTIELTGPALDAFAHSMETEADVGAEWEVDDKTCLEMIDLFKDLGRSCRWQARLEKPDQPAASAGATPGDELTP